VNRGFELWMHQQAGQEAPGSETPPPGPEQVAVDPTDPIEVLIAVTKTLVVSAEKNYAITRNIENHLDHVEGFLAMVGHQGNRTAAENPVIGQQQHRFGDYLTELELEAERRGRGAAR